MASTHSFLSLLLRFVFIDALHYLKAAEQYHVYTYVHTYTHTHTHTHTNIQKKKKQTPCELYWPSGGRRLSAVSDSGVSRSQRDGSLTVIISLSRPESLFFFQAALLLYSRGWVDPVPDPLLHRKPGSAGNGTRTSGSVARNSDH
jgi:hypothetical protein